MAHEAKFPGNAKYWIANVGSEFVDTRRIGSKTIITRTILNADGDHLCRSHIGEYMGQGLGFIYNIYLLI